MKKMRPTEHQKKQLAALDALRDADIDLSGIPDQGRKTGWVRGIMYRPVTRAISIRLPAPDIELARQLAGRKSFPTRLTSNNCFTMPSTGNARPSRQLRLRPRSPRGELRSGKANVTYGGGGELNHQRVLKNT
jgi:hypothetical protein